MDAVAELTPTAIAQLTAEAMAPETTPDSVMLCGREIAIKLMPIKREKQVVKLVAPLLPKIAQFQSGEIDAMGDVAIELADALPKAIAIITGNDPDQDWIEENCSIIDLIPVVTAQLAKYGQQDALGKLFKRSVPSM